MCVMSNIGDQYQRDFPIRWPAANPIVYPSTTTSPIFGDLHPDAVSKEDFAALRKEVEELKILLLAARRFDEATGQKDCEMDEKVAFLRGVAEFVGVDLEEVFGK